jgi:hypothetical protein
MASSPTGMAKGRARWNHVVSCLPPKVDSIGSPAKPRAGGIMVSVPVLTALKAALDLATRGKRGAKTGPAKDRAPAMTKFPPLRGSHGPSAMDGALSHFQEMFYDHRSWTTVEARRDPCA